MAATTRAPLESGRAGESCTGPPGIFLPPTSSLACAEPSRAGTGKVSSVLSGGGGVGCPDRKIPLQQARDGEFPSLPPPPVREIDPSERSPVISRRWTSRIKFINQTVERAGTLYTREESLLCDIQTDRESETVLFSMSRK